MYRIIKTLIFYLYMILEKSNFNNIIKIKYHKNSNNLSLNINVILIIFLYYRNN